MTTRAGATSASCSHSASSRSLTPLSTQNASRLTRAGAAEARCRPGPRRCTVLARRFMGLFTDQFGARIRHSARPAPLGELLHQLALFFGHIDRSQHLEFVKEVARRLFATPGQ